MNAAVLHTLGKPPRYEQFPEPVPNGQETLGHVRVTAVKPVDKQMAKGSHYARASELPVVCGIDGVGKLEDGSRVFFAAPRRPHGAMAERTVVDQARCWRVPEGLDDISAAALDNPSMSAWLSLAFHSDALYISPEFSYAASSGEVMYQVLPKASLTPPLRPYGLFDGGSIDVAPAWRD